MISEKEIEETLRRLAPFHHAVDLPHGLSTYVPELSKRPIEKTRVKDLMGYITPVLIETFGSELNNIRLLDVACNCGGFSFASVDLGVKEVLGIDITDHYLEQAQFIKRARNIEKAEFLKLDVEQLDKSNVGQFDLTYCFDVLYHFENPVKAMKKIASVTQKALFVETYVLDEPEVEAHPYWLMNFLEASSNEAWYSSTSLWRTENVCQFTPTTSAIIELLKFTGFEHITQIELSAPDAAIRTLSGDKKAIFFAQRPSS